MKKWNMPSYKVFSPDSEYTDSRSVRVSQYVLFDCVAVDVYWIEEPKPADNVYPEPLF